VMDAHKADLSGWSTRALLARRARLARVLPGAEQMLMGSLVEQTRRCGKPGCRCAGGDPHGPYVYFTPKTAGRGRARYVPETLVAAVRGWLTRGERVAAAIEQISAINAELLARRELR
jgi:hypothetical protein